MESKGFQIDVDTAKAALAVAQARFALARDSANRQHTPYSQGAGAEAKVMQTAFEAEIAKAAVKQAQAVLASAELAWRALG